MSQKPSRNFPKILPTNLQNNPGGDLSSIGITGAVTVAGSRCCLHIAVAMAVCLSVLPVPFGNGSVCI